jgi:hypothetical protein
MARADICSSSVLAKTVDEQYVALPSRSAALQGSQVHRLQIEKLQIERLMR